MNYAYILIYTNPSSGSVAVDTTISGLAIPLRSGRSAMSCCPSLGKLWEQAWGHAAVAPHRGDPCCGFRVSTSWKLHRLAILYV